LWWNGGLVEFVGLTLILFDVDGTLAASGAEDARCFAQAFQSVFGQPVPTTDWHAYTHVTDTGILDEVLREQRGSAYTQEELQAFQREYLALLREAHKEDPSAFAEVPGAASVLETIAGSSEYRAGIATGGLRACASFKISCLGIEATTLPGGFANDSHSRAEIARHAIARADADTDDVVYVGDGLWDLKTAVALGVRFIGITWESSEERMRAAGATHCLRDYTDMELFFEAVRDARVPGTCCPSGVVTRPEAEQAM